MAASLARIALRRVSPLASSAGVTGVAATRVASFATQVATDTAAATKGVPFAETGLRPAEGVAAVYPEDSIFSREGEDDIFRQVHFDTEARDVNADPEFRALVNELFNKHKPSAHPFFANLKNAPKEVATNKGFLTELYTRYQTCMHITRAMVWYAPYLDSPLLRQRKCAIIADDDAIDKRSHHKQLEVMFTRFGADCPHEDEFGEISDLKKFVHESVFGFIDTVERLYKTQTGSWCIAEVLSDDWLSAFADSLGAHFDDVREEEYFDEIFTGHVEILHMLETVSLTEDILVRHPEVREKTIAGAREMAESLDKVWDNLNDLVLNPKPFMS